MTLPDPLRSPGVGRRLGTGGCQPTSERGEGGWGGSGGEGRGDFSPSAFLRRANIPCGAHYRDLCLDRCAVPKQHTLTLHKLISPDHALTFAAVALLHRHLADAARLFPARWCYFVSSGETPLHHGQKTMKEPLRLEPTASLAAEAGSDQNVRGIDLTLRGL